MEDTKETRPDESNRNDVHTNLEKLREHAQGLHRSTADGIPELKEEGT